MLIPFQEWVSIAGFSPRERELYVDEYVDCECCGKEEVDYIKFCRFPYDLPMQNKMKSYICKVCHERTNQPHVVGSDGWIKRMEDRAALGKNMDACDVNSDGGMFTFVDGSSKWIQR